ncbi:hypothetical protein FOPE_03247 [Fonsecaea pedrosoi]|nr:hypothetical protein FOPE_03247 [Fonsecaea pedrosoi]
MPAKENDLYLFQKKAQEVAARPITGSRVDRVDVVPPRLSGRSAALTGREIRPEQQLPDEETHPGFSHASITSFVL